MFSFENWKTSARPSAMPSSWQTASASRGFALPVKTLNWLNIDAGPDLRGGATPLVWIDRWAARHGLDRVAVKLESANPTGSFKDRGTTVVVSHARALGVDRLVEDSSGNAGASVAAYAARAGLPATIYVPTR